MRPNSRNMTKKQLLVECIELAVRHGYHIGDVVGVSIRSLNFEWIAEFTAELRELDAEEQDY